LETSNSDKDAQIKKLQEEKAEKDKEIA